MENKGNEKQMFLSNLFIYVVLFKSQILKRVFFADLPFEISILGI